MRPGRPAREGPNGRESETTVSLEGAGRQMSRQLELPLKSRGEDPKDKRSGEAPAATSGGVRSGDDHLMERVVERGNARLALRPDGTTQACRLTSTVRTAGCGPARPVVWEGSRGQRLCPLSRFGGGCSKTCRRGVRVRRSRFAKGVSRRAIGDRRPRTALAARARARQGWAARSSIAARAPP